MSKVDINLDFGIPWLAAIIGGLSANSFTESEPIGWCVFGGVLCLSLLIGLLAGKPLIETHSKQDDEEGV